MEKMISKGIYTQGRRYGFWGPWTAFSIGPSCVPGGVAVGVPLRTDHVPVESPPARVPTA